MSGHQAARRATDALAVALEEAGFDVGRAYPELRTTIDQTGAARVESGPMEPATAVQLAELLTRAAGNGITVATLGH
ncbi:hypothetical protein KZZ52_51555 [Dactylosporangium sp. AC04546]|uniref:hypothetical protein n=1 Tax=Dactylosporangium sp. AC04546 TaxID=2862460 RepID=UPI001EDF3ADF|nr:hypothetical protein [Dactylosporangium sp. AC04546]WVK82298.1 hypothetical protein KZZ52_51555 [Dactylosporangium sp. AC04546]